MLIKEYDKQNKLYIIRKGLRDDGWVYFEELCDEAKKDFPHLCVSLENCGSRKDWIKVVNNPAHRFTFGIGFTVKGDVHKDYTQLKQSDYKLTS